MHHIRDHTAPIHGAQHRHHRGYTGARGQEQHLRRRRLGEYESALRRGQPHHTADRDTIDQMAGEEPLRHGLHRDRDEPLALMLGIGPIRRAGQRIRAPMPAALHQHADTDVLARGEFEVETPARLDHQGDRIRGLLAHLHNAPAQFPRGPQRIHQMQIVIGQQGSGDPCGRTTQRIQLRASRGRALGDRSLQPFPESPRGESATLRCHFPERSCRSCAQSAVSSYATPNGSQAPPPQR